MNLTDDDDMEINLNDESVSKYEELLHSFEDLELNIPTNGDYSQFLSTNQLCIEKVLRLIETEEDMNSTYFLALLQIKESLDEQRNLLLNLSSTEGEHLIEKSLLPGNSQQSMTEDNTILSKCQPTAQGLADVIGLSDVKQVLIEAIIYPIKYPNVFNGARKPWNRILLYGPPGTGKTFIANAIAAEIQTSFYNLSSADLLSKYIGESEKLIREFFIEISINQNQKIVLIDEIDSLCKSRLTDEPDHIRRVKTQLLTAFDNLNNSKTVLICTTNCPWDLDSAFIRRFQRKIYVPLPKDEERKEIISKNMKNVPVQLSDQEWIEIINKTVGYSGSDLTNVANCALYEPVRDLDNCKYWINTADGFVIPSTVNTVGSFQYNIEDIDANKIRVRDVMYCDFIKAIHCIPKSVQDTELKKFEDYTTNCCSL